MQITKKLGSAAPVITCFAEGIIGSDGLTEEFKEVNVCLLILFAWLGFFVGLCE